MAAKRRAGRPSSYKPEYADQAKKVCALGATDVEVADFFGINVATLYRWRHDYPEFCEALKLGKAEPDERVQRSLYQRAIGYTHDTVKIISRAKGKPLVVPYREHVPPDTTACIFWLKNRQPDQWRDRQEHTGAGGGPIETKEIGGLELARRLAFILTNPSASQGAGNG